MTKNILYTIIFLAVTFQACDDQIHPKLPTTSELLVIDAWLNNIEGNQTIYLTKSQDYFDNTAPKGAIGAVVTVTDNIGNTYNFTDNNDGIYIWTPSYIGETIGTVGNDYTLSVNYEGEEFTAQSSMNRVPSLDSVTYRYQEKTAFTPEFFMAEFWSRDPLGAGDAYWIKSYKNGQFLSKPSELNIAYDAGVSKGGGLDNLIFIPPLRDAINPFDQDEDDDFLSPYSDGDSIYVEIHSITEEAFTFLTQVVIQTNRPGGFAELFAQPLSNVPSNIENQNANSDKVAIGFFNVAAVSGNGKRLVESEVPRE